MACAHAGSLRCRSAGAGLTAPDGSSPSDTATTEMAVVAVRQTPNPPYQAAKSGPALMRRPNPARKGSDGEAICVSASGKAAKQTAAPHTRLTHRPHRDILKTPSMPVPDGEEPSGANAPRPRRRLAKPNCREHKL